MKTITPKDAEKMTRADIEAALPERKERLSRLDRLSDRLLDAGLWSLGGAMFAGVFALAPLTVAALSLAVVLLGAHVALDNAGNRRFHEIADLQAAIIDKTPAAPEPASYEPALSAVLSPSFDAARKALEPDAPATPGTPFRAPKPDQ